MNKIRLFTIVVFLTVSVNNQITKAQTFEWAFGLDGSMAEHGVSILHDSTGNIYTVGYFSSTTDFDPGPGVFNMSSAGIGDIYIAKYTASATLIWAKRIGGLGGEEPFNINLDATGNIFVVGYFSNTVDFDPGPATFSMSSAGSVDAFVLKLDSNGNFIWAKRIGSGGQDYFSRITFDTTGKMCITGSFQGVVDVDPGPGIHNLTTTTGIDCFILALDANANFLWSFLIASNGYEGVDRIAFDNQGYLYTAGHFSSTCDFDPGPGVFNLTSAGLRDVFVCKLKTDGSFVWAKRMGGVDIEESYDIILGSDSKLYVTGTFKSTTDFDPGPGTTSLTPFGSTDLFVMKLDTSGNLIWAKQMGGTAAEAGEAIEMDINGDIYLTGSFTVPGDYDPGPAIFTLVPMVWGERNAFITKLNSDGNLLWGKNVGGLDYADGTDLTVDDDLNVYVTGSYDDSTDFNPGFGNYFLYSATYASFILKLSDCEISTSSFSTTACSPYITPSGLQALSASGSYVDVIPNAVNCDSLITINLTIIPPSTSTIFPVACNSYTSPSGNYVWTTSDTYSDIVLNSNGCDSVILINLTIQSTSSSVSISECNTYVSPSGNYIWTASGTYSDTLTNAVGCDSVITVNLSINTNSSIISPVACYSYVSPSGNYTWNSTGVYLDTLINSMGCDSVLFINLTVVYPDTLVTQNDSLLTANATAASYQWLNCSTGYIPVAGATNASFIPSYNGMYAVSVTQNGCADTSSCYQVFFVTVNETASAELSCFPNPTSEVLIIQYGGINLFGEVVVFSSDGKTWKKRIEHNQINVSDLADGVYSIEINDGLIYVRGRFIKTH